jgi:hypothetical protein
MKRLSVILVSLILLAGCTLTATGTSPKRAAEDLLGKYQSLDEVVVKQLDAVINHEDLTATQKSDYVQLMKKQYQDLAYTIKDETIDGDTAVVKVEIEVYDLAKASSDAEAYVSSHPNELVGEDGKASDSLYEDYKVSQLKAATSRIKYTLDLGATKINNTWKLNDLSDVERQKIHGLYSA